jgi:hypothetical protein
LIYKFKCEKCMYKCENLYKLTSHIKNGDCKYYVRIEGNKYYIDKCRYNKYNKN